MKLFLIRHGKSDKSLQDKLPHNEFELKRPLVEGEAEKAQQLGQALQKEIGTASKYDFVHSGKLRSKQTVLAIAKGLGRSAEEANAELREDSGLSYLAEKEYWQAAEHAIKNGLYTNLADFFLKNPSPKGSAETFSAEYIRKNMRSVLRRAIERNIFLKNDVSIMVSHEPVISLCLSDLSGESVDELGGQCNELEYAVFDVNLEGSQNPEGKIRYRNKTY